MNQPILAAAVGAILCFWPATSHGQGALLWDPEESEGADRILRDRDVARARFEVSQSSARELAKKRTEAIRAVAAARLQEFRSGRGAIGLVAEAQVLLARSQDPLPDRLAANRTALEVRWRLAWAVCELNRLQFESARIPASDYYHSLYQLHDAAVALALTRPKK